jgi:CBS domain containing-hemolysin-like protein
MALVEDEAKQVIGLVTLEDVLEEIVGDLTDEFDHLSEEIIQVAPRRWKIGGGARLDHVAQQLGVNLSARTNPTWSVRLDAVSWSDANRAWGTRSSKASPNAP